MKLKHQLETGELKPTEEELASYKANRKQNRAEEKERRQIEKLELQKKEKIRFLQTEATLAAMDLQIKKSLKTDCANIDHALAVMNDLERLQVSSLMLKKNPEILSTIKKVGSCKSSVIYHSLCLRLDPWNIGGTRICMCVFHFSVESTKMKR